MTGSPSPAAVGGGLFNRSISPTLTESTFTGNDAAFGGGVYNVDASPTVTNCTFADNSGFGYTGGNGGVMYNSGGSSPTMTNCIFWGNHPDTFDGPGTPVVSYCNVEGGYGGQGNMTVDPVFVDPDAGDYHLSPGSPCTDAGDNTAVPGAPRGTWQFTTAIRSVVRAALRPSLHILATPNGLGKRGLQAVAQARSKGRGTPVPSEELCNQ